MLDSNFSILLKRGTQRGLQTLLRENEWATAFGALFGIFVLLQLLLLIVIGVNGVQSVLRSQTDLRLEVRDEASDESIRELYEALQNHEAVSEVLYITKEQAYERTKQRDPDLIAFIDEFGLENPFPDIIGVTLNSLDDYDAFTTFIEQDQWQTIIDPTFLTEATQQEEHVYELLKLSNAGMSLTIVFLGIVALTLIFITTELVRRRALSRAEEVLVERLVGATNMNILLPFIIEATFLFWGAIIASTVFLIVLLFALPVIIPSLIAGGSLSSLTQEMTPMLYSTLPLFVLIELLLAPVLATLGAWVGMQKQLKSRALVWNAV